jgi:hypothetical protein
MRVHATCFPNSRVGVCRILYLGRNLTSPLGSCSNISCSLLPLQSSGRLECLDFA